MALHDLARIRNDVRQLTHSLSPSILTDASIDDWVNDYMLYDMPNTMRVFSLRTQLSFYTQPNVDYYQSSTNVGDALYNFKNKYLNVYGPVWVNGIAGSFTNDPNMFNAAWYMPFYKKDTLLRGNGTTGPYVGSLAMSASVPAMQRNVCFSAVDATGTAHILTDNPVSNTTGALGLPNLPQTLPSIYGQINYITGAYTLNFPAVIPNGTFIYSQSVTYTAGRPYAVLFFKDAFTLRPVPDSVYKITLEADVRPTEIIQATDVPYQDQWWQLISMGAALKVLQRRGDAETEGYVRGLYREQLNLVLRPTLLAAAQERPATVFNTNFKRRFGWPFYNWPY